MSWGRNMADEQTNDADEAQPASPGFHAVVLDSEGVFRVESFTAIEELAQRLKQLIDTDVSVACFSGSRLAISKPPYRYLLTPEGNVALFDVPEELEPDDTGYLGVDPAHLESPPVLPTSRPQSDNEFFSDASEEIGNIFDEAMPDPDA